MTRVLLRKHLDAASRACCPLGYLVGGGGDGTGKGSRGHPMPRHLWGYSDLGRNSTCYCVAPI